MKKSTASAATATAAATGSIPLWYTAGVGDISTILEANLGFDPRTHIASFIHQPPTSQTSEPESTNLTSAGTSSPSPKLNPNKPLNCTSSAVNTVTGNLINGMANSQLLTGNVGAIAFPSNAHQQPSQQPQQAPPQVQQPPQQQQSQQPAPQQQPGQQQASSLQNTTAANSGVHHLLSQNLLSNNSRAHKAKQSRGGAGNNGPQHSNGITNLSASAQPLFLGGTSVAFPGNPLQPQQIQQQNQNFQSQQHQNSRQNQQQQQQQQQMQQSPQQQGVLLSSLNPNGSPVRSLVNNPTTSSITSPNAAAVAAAVAAANNPANYQVTSWPCPACKIGFRSASELQTHLSAHFVPSQNTNNSKATSSANSLVVHTNHFNTSLNQSNQTSQQQHQQQQQQSHNQSQFNHNPNVTAKKDSSVHLKKDKSVPCNECGKLFASAERVRVHVRVAHGEKTCACEICGCGFSYRCKLLNHMRTHTGDKPFTCEICGRSFSQKNHLKRHHMIHTGERPFPCEICGRSFYRKDKLTRHRRIHTNTNPTGRGARNSAAAAAVAAAQAAKNVVASSMVLTPNNVDVAAAAAMAAAASNKSAAMPSIAQQFSSIPGATIQLIPVSMAAQIRGAAALGQNQNWVPLAHQVEHHRGGASDQKSPNDGRQQTVGIKLTN